MSICMCVCVCVNVCGYVIRVCVCMEHYRLFLVADILWSPIEIESKKISMKHEFLRHILNLICMSPIKLDFYLISSTLFTSIIERMVN